MKIIICEGENNQQIYPLYCWEKMLSSGQMSYYATEKKKGSI